MNHDLPPTVPPKNPNDDTEEIELSEADIEEEPTELSTDDLIFEEEPDASDVSGKVERASAETRGEWQKMEQVKGRIEAFDDKGELSVHFDMRKDQDKRPGDEPGEDMFLADKKTGLTGVFDGLGGEGGGDKASAKAAEMAPTRYEEVLALLKKDPKQLEALGSAMIEKQAGLAHPSMRDRMVEAGKKMWSSLPDALKVQMVALYETVGKLNGDVRATKGLTTLTLGKTVELPDGRMFEVVANVGDSGAFKVRADGSASELTQEDSTLDQALSMGLLTPEEAQDPDHLVTLPGGAKAPVSKLRAGMYQALGGELDSPRISVTEIRPGEKVVYVTDGVRDIRAFESDGHFDAAKAAEALAAEDGENLASALAGKSTDIERQQKTDWGLEKARAELAGKAPDKRKRPKEDEKTVLVKERRAPKSSLKVAS